MDPEKIDYPAILQDALRDAVRRVLEQVAEHGLPGEHHFFIGFRTRFPGVEVPRSLLDQYPEEMAIILQYQFWDLDVTPDSFSVLLAFGRSHERIVVPFAAVTEFADPSVHFRLRFETVPSSAEPASEPAAKAEEPEEPAAPEPSRSAEVIRFDRSRRR